MFIGSLDRLAISSENGTRAPSPHRGLVEARQGSEKALGELFESCRNYLLLVANQELDPVLRAKVSPLDLVQETFLRAHHAFDRFTGSTEDELLAWLRRILLNHLINVGEQFRGTQ